MWIKIPVVTLAAIFLIAVVSGCGEDSPTASLTKAEFVAKADKVCEKSEEVRYAIYLGFAKKREQAEKENVKLSDEEVFAGGDEHFFQTVNQLLDDISAFGLPSEETEGAEEVLEQMETGLEAAEEDPAKLFTGDAFNAANEAASAYGLKRCSI